MTPERVDELLMGGYPKAGELNDQLHAVLVSLTTMGTTAFDIVKNTKKKAGLDAWRKLARKFEPKQPSGELEAA